MFANNQIGRYKRGTGTDEMLDKWPDTTHNVRNSMPINALMMCDFYNTGPHDKHNAATEGQPPPDSGSLKSATDSGNVVLFPTQLDADISGQPSPDWDSCQPGNDKWMNPLGLWNT